MASPESSQIKKRTSHRGTKGSPSSKSSPASSPSKSLLDYFSPSKDSLHNSGNAMAKRKRQNALGKLHPNTFQKDAASSPSKKQKKNINQNLSNSSSISNAVDTSVNNNSAKSGSASKSTIAITSTSHQDQSSSPEKHGSKFQMVLLPVTSKTKLTELANLLQDPKSTQALEHIHLSANKVMGRKEIKKKAHKISLNIPSTESGISREHLQIFSIREPTSLPKEDKKDPAEKIKDFQKSFPEVGIENKSNSIFVIKARVQKNVLLQNELFEHVKVLEKKERIFLKVGDMIVMDAWKNSASTKGSTGTSHILKCCKYVYRLVGIRSTDDQKEDDEDMAIEKKPAGDQIGTKKSLTENEIDGKPPARRSTRSVKPSVCSGEPKSVIDKRSIGTEGVKPSKRKTSSTVNEKESTSPHAGHSTKKGDPKTARKSSRAISSSVQSALDSNTSMSHHHNIDEHEPKEGEMYRVKYPMKDLFGKKHGCWFTTTATKVKKQGVSWLLTLQFGDGRITEKKYPHRDVDFLHAMSGDGKYYIVGSNDEESRLGCDCNPSDLTLGDYIECKYQDGDKWYAGRVAHIDEAENRVDVVYLEGFSYEVGVPCGKGMIRLLERASHQPLSWIGGAEIVDGKSYDFGHRVPKAKIVKIEFDDDDISPDDHFDMNFSSNLSCIMKRSNGEKETLPFKSALRALFSSLRKQSIENLDNVISWPGHGTKKEMEIDYNPFPKLLLSDICDSSPEKSTIEERNVITPKVGDRCRVRMTQTDIFNGKHEMHFIGSIGEVNQISSLNKYKVKILWDDKTEGMFLYPNHDFQLLRCDPSLGATAYVDANIMNSTDVLWNSNPSELELGDLVDGYYQDGASDGRWWTGRIVSLRGKDKVDIAYLDGEVETEIPRNCDKIRLSERASENAEFWLVGAEYDVTTTQNGRRKCTRVMEINECDGKNACLVRKPNGDLVHEDYNSVVKKLCVQLLESKEKDDLIRYWPNSKRTEKATVKSEPAVDITTRDEAMTEGSDDTYEVNIESLSLPSGDLSEDYGDLITSDSSEQNIMRPSISDLSYSQANLVWGHLNSNEPHVGFSLLSHMFEAWNMMPNKGLKEYLSEFLIRGPSHNNIEIHQTHRMELVFDYLHRFVNKQNDEDFTRDDKTLPLVLHQLLPLVNLGESFPTEGDISSRQLNEATQKLQLAAKSLSFLAYCVEEEIKELCKGECVSLDMDNCSEYPYVSSIISSDIRKTLKETSKAMIILWTEHGHLHKAKEEIYHKFTKEARECSNALGSLVCNISWILCEKEKEEFPRHACFVIRDVVDSAMNTTTYPKSETKRKLSKKDKDAYLKQISLDFIFGLDSQLSYDIQIMLAEMYGVSDEVALVLT